MGSSKDGAKANILKDSPSKPSVAELAGRFKGHILPMPNSSDELPFRRRPPCSLKLQNDNEESDKNVSPSSFKIKKNSAIIEKLQANLALSPTALLPSPKSPDVKLQPASLSPTMPCSPLSPTVRLPHLSSEDEDPISFDSPPEGTPLPSFNKTRARLSFKRRPPTRQHRRSAGEEAGAAGSGLSPCELHAPNENGDKEQVYDNLTEEAEFKQLDSLTEVKNKDEDCEKIDADAAQNDPDVREKPQQEVEQDKCAEPLEEEEEEPKPFKSAEQMEDDVKTEEGQTPQESQHDGCEL
ncbi:capZ-interacting protein isoform X2 [Melanotaenia boesemani]|uniref:capZ-interacting protein isoform X2 n=1 Tax=Melanotaenia boesemani TaxID=1250792 RepID=UPI001C03B992|nr:capZ-interacting protein isoform X2 [Melanotaenia boesemani]